MTKPYLATLLRLALIGTFSIGPSHVIAANTDARQSSIQPMEHPTHWQSLAYRNIPVNKVSFQENMIQIKVKNSASPLIYPFSAPVYIDSVNFKVNITGDLSLSDKKQGSKGADDSVFRLGLVYEGTKNIGVFEKQLAPQWVKKLYKLAPENSGIDVIEFYNVYSDQRIAGLKRKHPLSPLLVENNIYSYQEAIVKGSSSDQTMSMITGDIKPNSQKRVLAIWISSDGDDTQSSFRVNIEKLNIKLQ